MIKTEFPKDQLKIQQRENVNQIFDAIRKKWVLLTPEEWVRQNMLQYLLVEKKYPASLIAVEKEIRLGPLKKRCDIVVYDRASQPWMIIECKEMKVTLSEKTMEQILRYHLVLPAKYLLITNGSFCRGFQKAGDRFEEIGSLPDFSS